MKIKIRPVSENIARKSKCDLIAQIIESKKVSWHESYEGKFFIFIISNELRIFVDAVNIILNYRNIKTDLNNPDFWNVLEVALDEVRIQLN